jgi:hypothetical protein
MDNIDKKVININYPCIQDIVITKDETDVCFTVSDGQDETKLFLKDDEKIMFTVNFGDVSGIGFGGTDNWGKDRLPLYVNYTKGSVDYDSVFVDTIEIQKLAGDGDWCKCELINNNKNVKYTALAENPYNVERRAYFYHKTKDDTVKNGYNAGRPASKEWCVTVIQKANPKGKPITVECKGETVGNGIAVSSAVSTTKVAIGTWSKNSDCTESWAVDKSRQITGTGFINLDSIEFRSDNKIYGAVNVANTTTSSRSYRIPTKLGDFQDYFTVTQAAGKAPVSCNVTLELVNNVPGSGYTNATYIGKYNITGDCAAPTALTYVSGDGDFISKYTINSAGGFNAVISANPNTKSRTSKYSVTYGGKTAYANLTQLAGSTPTPTPDTGTTDLGAYKYKVGLISDLHICQSNGGQSGDWWDEDDFKRAMGLFVDDKDVKFIASCGDIAESQTNDNVKHPEAVCDVDYAEFIDMYDVPYWQVAGLRFFSPLGNHDFYGLFESREGDTITGKKNSECIVGYNSSVNTRIANLWPTGQQVNGIVPGRGRIVFELESGKSTATGQADMRFFSFNDYVDLYARKGGYTGSSIWDSSKGGISDTAIKCAKQYVNSNWASVKDNLVMWNDGGGHGRNGYSKLNYWMKKDNDIFIFLSVDYGNDVWGVTSGWHDRMIHARTIINLNEDDPYIKRMKEYVSDTSYSSADEAYNYQYYSPNTLIWLKELLENNKDKKIYIFTHHFMPSRVGNGVGLPKDGNWFYSVISPNGVKDDREGGKYNKGSNALTGVEYWFINKLMNTYKNVVWFNGHSHISYSANANFDNHEYPIVSPSAKNEYVYTKSSLTPTKEAAWCVSLPSTSKPRGIENGQSVRHYEDAEMGIMEIYEKGIKIKGYKIKENNKDVNKLLTEKSIKLI